MAILRRRLSWLICAWLGVQMAGIVVAPLALCCEHDDAAASLPACCRAAGAAKQCPMHHGPETDRTCRMRSACTPSDAALVTLAGGLGVLPSSTVRLLTFAPAEIVRADASAPLLRSDRPESPPPRI